ncbi:hypothetical protein [Microvirga sp. 2TAF3]|uniref:hypothetical protein n=1 Tax=Microvirga sp. 2TAF3 TaxID=3233014 RepID=UPI003F9835B4
MPNLLFATLATLSLIFAPGLALAQKPKEESRQDMTFVALDASSICADCSIVQASGSFGDETIKAYYDFVWRGRFKKNIYFVFDSPGGSMGAALQLGGILRNLKVNTVVGRAVIRNGEVEIEPGRCASACVFAFVGGTTRSMPKDSRLGVHGWMPRIVLELEGDKAKKAKPRLLDQDSVTALHRLTALHLKYLDMMGVDLRIAVLALQTPYRGIAWVSPRDQSLWRVVTVDSRLSTPADRRWPVLFLPQTAPPVSAGDARQHNREKTSV